VTSRPPRWRVYLLLARVSNLPTVWTNVLAGLTVSQVPFSWTALAGLSTAVSLMYCGGMFLNDAFDSVVDSRLRPERPIPSGGVSRGEAFTIGFGLIGSGEVAIAIVGKMAALLWGVLLGAAIVYYDARHKGNSLGPLVMGSCRGLVYCVAAAAVSGVVTSTVVWTALVMAGYVIALTWVAKRAGPRAGWLVPVLLAGVSLVDAAVIGLFGPAWLSWMAVSGFVLTLICQRFVPGT
jgi:4-hydroxybenzoate polyprenyltransferase